MSPSAGESSTMKPYYHRTSFSSLFVCYIKPAHLFCVCIRFSFIKDFLVIFTVAGKGRKGYQNCCKKQSDSFHDYLILDTFDGFFTALCAAFWAILHSFAVIPSGQYVLPTGFTPSTASSHVQAATYRPAGRLRW